MKLLNEINKYPVDSKLAILIRHADRELIPSGEIGNEIPINETGSFNALSFGNGLKSYCLNKIFTSPILRCIQTAEKISEGYGQNVEIITTKSLGAPGLHVTDERIAGEFYVKYGFDEMYRRFTNHELIPGIPNSAQFLKSMNDFLLLNTNQRGLSLFITHDSLIAFYHFCINRTIYTKENWVNYLSGLILNFSEDEK